MATLFRRLTPLLPVLTCVGLSLGAGTVQAQAVRCHMTYGGATKAFTIPPVRNELDAPVQAEGSYFIFRVVNLVEPIDLAAVKVYVYANADNGPRLIHQGTWMAAETPASGTRRPHGFTGIHKVYEPLRDGELQYWCERLETAAP
jgi:hypothetical protein